MHPVEVERRRYASTMEKMGMCVVRDLTLYKG
jgi:hypothetical protein